MNKVILNNLSKDELKDWIIAIGEKPFRTDQLWSWMYGRCQHDFDGMTNLSKSFRENLKTIAEIKHLDLISMESSKSGTRKYLWGLQDGNRIESVFIPDGKRKTICISSQVGCQMGCKFCATATMGFLRNLEPYEIVDQIMSIIYELKEKPTNVVVMGMGEPFLNYENVIKALYILNDADGLAIGHRKMTLSTSGLIPQINRYTQEGHPFKLAVSLNATTDQIRSKLMPVNRRYPLNDLMDILKQYAQKSGKRVTFEYVLIKDVNDSEEDAKRIKTLTQNIPCKINLIAYNATGGTFSRPEKSRILQFSEWLSPMRAPVTLRLSKGDDINGACGQLVTRK